MDNNDLRVYDPSECAVFCKTAAKHGGCSNMAGGYPLLVNGEAIRTSEALYQACRFPGHIEIQRAIIEAKSPMTAKMKGKPFQKTHTRPDWDLIRVNLMRWCLRVKLLQHWLQFSAVLLGTGSLPIVEQSRRDKFWGAIFVREGSELHMAGFPIGALVGYNVLGRLNQELRENIRFDTDPMSFDFTRLPPLAIDNFLLFGKPIEEIIRL